MRELFESFNVAWTAVAACIGLVIWAYRIRIDTTINAEKIKTLQENQDKDRVNHDEEFHQLQDRMYDEIDKTKREINETIKEMSDEQSSKIDDILQKIDRLTESVTELKIEIRSQTQRGCQS